MAAFDAIRSGIPGLDRALDRAALYRVHNLNTGYIVGMLAACLTAPAGSI